MTKELVRDEAVKLKPYYCPAGKLTIGIGRNLQDKGITLAEAHMLCKNDIVEVVEGLRKALPWFDRLDEVRQRVLVNMGFNMGVEGLVKGWPNFIAAVGNKQYDHAAFFMEKSKWKKQVGARADRLIKMMKTGAV